MVCSNRLDLVPARTLLDALYHQTSFIAVECFLRNTIWINVLCSHLRTSNYRMSTTVRVPVERPPGRRLLSASLDKVGHRPSVPGCGRASRIFAEDRARISGFWPRLIRQSLDTRMNMEVSNITC